jgi:hypothetical protein
MRGGVSYGFSLFKNAGSRPAPQKGKEKKKKKKRKKRKENLIDSRIQPFLFPQPFTFFPALFLFPSALSCFSSRIFWISRELHLLH